MTMTQESPPTDASDETPVTPEIVERTGVEIERHEANRTIDRLTEGVLDTPGIPGRDEFLNLCLQAKLLSMSAAVPKGMRDNPHLCLHVVLLARDLGMSPTTALNLIDFIPEDGQHPERGGQLSLSPELLDAQVRRLGLGKVVTLSVTDEKAVAVALEPGGYVKRDIEGNPVEIAGEIGRSEFTWSDAVTAGLVDDRCTSPTNHWKKDGTRGTSRDDRCGCRTGWRTYPKRMLSWRAKGYAVHDHFPEAAVGLYSPEELGAEVDDQGRLIDPATVELPQGYEPPPPPPPSPDELPPADDDLALLKIAIAALDDQGRADLKSQWTAAKIPPSTSEDFTVAQYRKSLSILRSVENARTRAGWDKQAASAALEEILRTGEITGTDDTPESPQTDEEPPESQTPPEVVSEDPGAPQTSQETVRTDLDEVYRTQGFDALVDAVRQLQGAALTSEISRRGGDPFGNDDETRRNLAQMILDANPEVTPHSHPSAETGGDNPGVHLHRVLGACGLKDHADHEAVILLASQGRTARASELNRAEISVAEGVARSFSEGKTTLDEIRAATPSTPSGQTQLVDLPVDSAKKSRSPRTK